MITQADNVLKLVSKTKQLGRGSPLLQRLQTTSKKVPAAVFCFNRSVGVSTEGQNIGSVAVVSFKSLVTPKYGAIQSERVGDAKSTSPPVTEKPAQAGFSFWRSQRHACACRVWDSKVLVCKLNRGPQYVRESFSLRQPYQKRQLDSAGVF
jgi:hypothetical protein